MKRILISGLTWQLANQPCLVLVTESSDFVMSFPCDPAELSLFFRIAKREVKDKLPLLVSATTKIVAQSYLSLTSIELLERKESCDRAVVNALNSDGTIKTIEMTCLEAIVMGLIYNRPMFAAEALLSPVESVFPELSKEKKEHDAQAVASFIQKVKPSDFSDYAKLKHLGI